ncbi:hypothetical protein TRVL_09520 [Trypanosoma vivax]|nr:hypothetical protein TRVL_09520 [Trypanosoma vivax]
MKDGMVAATPLLRRSLQCPYCPVKCALKQCLAMHLQAKHGQPRREARHNSLKAECRESVAHLLECPSLRELRKEARTGNAEGRGVVLQCSTGQLLEGTLQAREPIRPNPDEPELRPARAVKRHCLPTVLDTTCSPSAAAKLIVVCTARAMRKRVREADSSSKATCFNVPLGEARMGSWSWLTSAAGLQSRRGSRETSDTAQRCAACLE